MSSFESDFQAWRRSRMQLLQDDFAELSRYREANARLAPAAQNEERVVFFGDSITEAWNLAAYFPGKPYINRGIGGQTTAQMLLRFRQDAVALRPDAAVILAGINDIGGNTWPALPGDIQANFASMAEIAAANGVRLVFSSLLPPPHRCSPLSRYNLLKHPPEKIFALNRWLSRSSAGRGLPFIDYFAAMSDGGGLIRQDFSGDGLHPAPAGYAIMAPLAQAAIERALASA